MDNSTKQQPPKKKGSLFVNILLLIVLILAIAWISNSCSDKNGPPEASVNRFYSDIGYSPGTDGPYRIKDFALVDVKDNSGTVLYKVHANKIHSVERQGDTYYVLLKSSIVGTNKQDAFLSNPSKNADYYFNLSGFPSIPEQIMLTELPLSLNTQLEVLRGVSHSDLTESFYTAYTSNFAVSFSDSPVTTSWFNLSNILTILTFVFLGVICFFIIRSFSNRGGLSNMGRNRATHTMGGAIRFSDVAGIEEEKEEVQEIVQFLRNPRKFLDLGARIPKGVLLVGQPGTGKTLLAKAIAGEAGVHFFSISGSDFSEMLVGVGPSRMRDLFETAKLNAPAIIFIDEIDSIARMRGVGVSGVSDENEQTLNQLLVQMDGFTKSEGVIVLAATNRPDVLDQALLRPGRFDRQIIVQMPDVKGREQILKVHAKGKPLGSDVNLKRVAQIISGFSGADIENLLNEAAIIAAKKDKKKISMVDLTEGINKVLLGPQKRSRIITEEDKKITAFHEAGHAIVSRMLQPNQVVQEVSIIPRGMAAGYTLTNDKDSESHHKSKKFLQTQLAVYMAGRVAEQIFIGDICTGSSNDLKVATNLAERMVTMFGMSDKLGPLYYGKEEEMALRLYNAQNPNSEALQATIDSEIKALIISAEKSAQDILKTHKSKVEIMTEVLIQCETIYSDDIDLILKDATAKKVIAEMEKRNELSREAEKKDMIESELAALEIDLGNIFAMAQSFVEAKLATPEKLEVLKTNMEMARETIRKGKTLSHLPTLDNLEEYAKLIEVEEQPVKPKRTRKKSEDEKTVAENKND